MSISRILTNLLSYEFNIMENCRLERVWFNPVWNKKDPCLCLQRIKFGLSLKNSMFMKLIIDDDLQKKLMLNRIICSIKIIVI